MRHLPAFVFAESIVLLGLVAWWFLLEESGRPPEPVTPPATSAVAGAHPAATPGPAAAPERRQAAPVASADGTHEVVVFGRLLGIEPPPPHKQVHLTFARDGESRVANVSEGAYAVAGLRSGPWRVRCIVPGCRMIDFSHTVGNTPIEQVDLRLEPATVLSVHIRTSSGGRLQSELTKAGIHAQLQVIATAAPLAGDLPPSGSDAVRGVGLGRHRPGGDRNSFADEQAGDGMLELDRPPPVHATLLLRHLVLAAQRIDPGQKELRFVVDLDAVRQRLATVRLRIVDGTSGSPLAGVEVDFRTSSQVRGSRVASGADGIVTRKDVMPGLHVVAGSSKGTESFSIPLDVPSGATLDLGDVVLMPAIAVRGRLVDENGMPCPGGVQWTDLDRWRAPQPLLDRRGSSADSQGNFELWGTGPHRYLVVATGSEDRRGLAIVDARAGAPPAFTVSLARTARVLLVAAGSALEAYTVVARTAQGDPVDSVRLELQRRELGLDLPPGDYTLEVFASDGRKLGSKPLALGTAGARVEVP